MKYCTSYLFFLVLIVKFVTGNVYAQQADPSALQQWDDKVMLNLAAHRTPETTGVMLFLSQSERYGNIGVPAGMLVGGIIGKDRDLRENALYVASSTLVSFGLTHLLKVIVKRPRPYVQNIRIVPVYQARGYSFPSGHTSSTFATATAVSVAYPKWYVIAPAFLWAGSVGYSRSYLGVHYPTDVASGALVGAASAVGMSFLKK